MLASRALLQQAAGSAAGLARSRSFGFIGLGAMGKEMCSNLTNAVFKDPDPELTIVVHDASERTITRFLTSQSSLHPGRRIVTANTPAGVARLASTIVTMLPSSPEVRQVYTAEDGILDGLADLRGNPSDAAQPEHSTLLLDSTTCDPATSLDVVKLVRSAGALEGSAGQEGAFEMLDCPVSGGVVGARAGSLSFMVGSDSPVSFARAEPTLLTMGARAIHCGKNSSGLIAKLCNNLLLGISMLGTAEAMLLGQAHGLNPQVLAHILNTSTGKCWSSETNNPAPGALKGTQYSPPADRDWEGGFAARLMAKDLGLAQDAAKMEGVPIALGTLTSNVYAHLAKNEELQNKDFSVVFKALSAALGNERLR
ncbi:hypothetical protein OC834_002131 [Tilletia horrida]|nr:hypothetical protein OC835_003772 [Tilletia horrida]KAK0533718.1 hypothetical protein OC834_002131 [Tilletia horrida]